jgi:hypothetical protein
VADSCLDGDYTSSYYDGLCGVKPVVNTSTSKPVVAVKKAIDVFSDADVSVVDTTNTISEEQVHNAPSKQAESIQFDDAQVYNTSITDGYCYNRKSGISILDSLSLDTTTEFKQAMTFLYAYDMTKVKTIDSFDPFSNLTREQAADMFTNFALNVLCREAKTDLTISYSDISSVDQGYQKSILLAYQL